MSNAQFDIETRLLGRAQEVYCRLREAITGTQRRTREDRLELGRILIEYREWLGRFGDPKNVVDERFYRVMARLRIHKRTAQQVIREARLNAEHESRDPAPMVGNDPGDEDIDGPNVEIDDEDLADLDGPAGAAGDQMTLDFDGAVRNAATRLDRVLKLHHDEAMTTEQREAVARAVIDLEARLDDAGL